MSFWKPNIGKVERKKLWPPVIDGLTNKQRHARRKAERFTAPTKAKGDN